MLSHNWSITCFFASQLRIYLASGLTTVITNKRYTYVAGHSFILVHQSFVLLINLEHFADAVSRSLRLAHANN